MSVPAAHVTAFCLGPGIVVVLLAISGAFTQSAKTAARAPHAHVHFTSRFGERLSGNSHSLLLVCLMAALAECWNSVVTPDLGSVFGVEVQGTLLNLSGACLGGVASALSDRGGRRGALWGAFNDGFVAAYTSFVFFVVHASELARREKETGAVDLSTPYLLGCLFLGPAAHLAGRRVGAALAGPVAADPPPADDPRGLAGPLAALLAAVVAREFARGGPEDGGVLLFGCGVTALACVAGELVGHLVEYELAFAVHEGDVNWGTAFANAVALALASCVFVVFRLPAYAAFRKTSGATATRVHVALDKVAGSFCGALSGFGAFSEDVAQTLREHDPDGALANLAVNAVVALSFKSLLLPIFDGALDS